MPDRVGVIDPVSRACRAASRWEVCDETLGEKPSRKDPSVLFDHLLEALAEQTVIMPGYPPWNS
ncbi:MAG TPA: DUF4158 domain-containing protein [Candidatus Yaniella excrementigallinarum]|nr:DUF4158 domain-containing protein [Candidatus Yaniella excrementigallinarum]